MTDITYFQSESTVKPALLEVGMTTVFLRKDIEEITRSSDDVSTTYWTYQEAKLTPEEFNQYSVMLNVMNIGELINNNNELIAQSASIAIDTEYLVCLAEIGTN